MPKDKELADHERAHTGKPGAKVRHGADALGQVPHNDDEMNKIGAHITGQHTFLYGFPRSRVDELYKKDPTYKEHALKGV